MSRYETDEEQWEAIKQWWKDNGKSIVLTVAITLAAVSGWKWWQTQQLNKALHASGTFELLQLKAQSGQFEEVAREAERLKTEQPDSPYASGAALLLGRYFAERKHDAAKAAEQFNWVVEHAPEAAMKDVAHLRLARLYADQKQFDKALVELNRVPQTGLPKAEQALYQYVAGEVALLKGDRAAARAAFEKVLELTDAQDLKQLAQLQLDDLADVAKGG